MKTNDQIANWAMNLQSLAQAGLHYGHDVFDRERYEEIRRIAGEMMSARTGIPKEKLKTLFLGDEGYQTPKIDTRAAIFKDNRILLVREKKTQEWSLLGGWNDYDQTTAQNCVKEAREEAGRIVEPIKIIAVQDRNHHNKPVIATNITKIFYLCKKISGKFTPNDETDACDYFNLDNLPKLSLGRNTKEQIAMCFDANNDPNWDTRFE
ncbi:ADP-ribose pyrophosphatase [Lactobacillus taiwanensis]|uniref:NUDIX hydrolase N-terminal domain-containing protein n=1 Tax=Lactobacillus taiwanensis TaxID=508451 RepID=UPI000B99A860|nr:NUDIX hydrolase [Lactobacillus taiwanensis]OYS21607.1 ADP-ribose pyrophosphatase [Lactobacillus taiwanensis]OYS24358.1 ADP-ribose pyrophosphatase [Lactobacillus taiwanensis]OYS25459.1 ADP-ribose pyrophosphatase [Lactobacillus taiwanensis]OYS25799.1 ADP-ribose pyrophosphatase [Lactobacillus taiwanensis]OYS27868.1 ADP-ribose pyrophosphatase [Lactobacillus taiwanensis]